jgi:hypothetical protein
MTLTKNVASKQSEWLDAIGPRYRAATQVSDCDERADSRA